MLLLDRNTRPSLTVYYISSILYKKIRSSEGIGSSELYEHATGELGSGLPNYRFYLMALDFLYLCGKINIDAEGTLSVY